MNTLLQTIPSAQIHIEKWDACIAMHQAPIYCRFHYLQTMATQWTALVLHDYQAVMPICYRKKFCIPYSYTPAFIQQLGWVGKPIATKQIASAVKKIVWLGDVMLQHSNNWFEAAKETKTNFILPLNKSYAAIAAGYKQDLIGNLKKAAKENLVYNSSENISEAIDLYNRFYGNRMQGVKQSDFDNFKTLCNKLQQTRECLVRTVNRHNGDLLAVAVLLKDAHRIYNLANSTTPQGRKVEANPFLMDNIIREFAGSNLLFDFEGSDLPGVKPFYEKFGAVNEPYFHWRVR